MNRKGTGRQQVNSCAGVACIKILFMYKLLIIMLLAGGMPAQAQDLARFSVKPVPGAGISPVWVSLDGLNYNTDNGNIALFEASPAGEKEVAAQVETGNAARLWFLFDNSGPGKNFVIRKVPAGAKKSSTVKLEKNEQGTILSRAGTPVLKYNHAEVFPPEGVDMKYKRAAFIHPLWSPGGEVMTRIQAPDHYHHYGIWNPWTKTTIDGREIDFWNLYKGQGTVKFGGYLETVEGQVYAGFKALQEHIFFVERGREKSAINEVWDVRVWETGEKGIAVVDLTTTLNTPLPNGIMLDAYRYGGGIGYRATEKWHKDNCTVLTSEGKPRAEADGSNARWCIVEGESAVASGRSGILFLSHPSNRMHPEPMRVWPLDGNGGRGDMFFEFCPIRHNDWKLDPGQSYTLKYRMVIFDGKMAAPDAEKHWKSFAAAPLVTFN
jgi:hypothetical protein